MADLLPIDFSAQVNAKIQETIGSMIPPEVFKGMIDRQIIEYIDKELPAQVNDELRKYFDGLLKAELAKPEWQTTWDGAGGQLASKAIVDIMTKNGSEIFASMMSGTAINIINHMRNSGTLPRY